MLNGLQTNCKVHSAGDSIHCNAFELRLTRRKNFRKYKFRHKLQQIVQMEFDFYKHKTPALWYILAQKSHTPELLQIIHLHKKGSQILQLT